MYSVHIWLLYLEKGTKAKWGINMTLLWYATKKHIDSLGLFKIV